MENFDPIGRWRDSYQSRKKGAPRLKVDPSGELPSGETFKGFSDFKKILAAHRSEPFTRHLISQVLTYASGRHMEALDQFEIDEILARVKQDKHGLRTLIRACLTSDIVRSR